MNGLVYIIDKLHQDFGEYAGIIYPLLDTRLAEMIDDTPPEEIAEFEELLIDAVHPFLSCYQAMVAAGVDSKFADRYLHNLIVEVPEEMRADFIMRAMKSR